MSILGGRREEGAQYRLISSGKISSIFLVVWATATRMPLVGMKMTAARMRRRGRRRRRRKQGDA